ncbi:MAG: hypothetical protein IPJ94_27890 [Chloroflexi bacterium]|nr:hypothetical protein [Chloroflexota bacterium]
MDLRYSKEQRILARSSFSEAYGCSRFRVYTHSFLVALPSFMPEPNPKSEGLNLVSYDLAETGDLSAVPDFSKSGHVEIWLGSLNKEYGLILGPSLDDGQHKVVTIDEVSARQTVAINEEAPNAYLYFHVDDGFDLNDTNNITIYVEYFDEGSEPVFRLRYDSSRYFRRRFRYV